MLRINMKLYLHHRTAMTATAVVLLAISLAQSSYCRPITSSFDDAGSAAALGKHAARSLAHVESGEAEEQNALGLIAGQYIVFFDSQAGPASDAARSLVAEVTASLAQQTAASSPDATVTLEQAQPADIDVADTSLEILREIGSSINEPAAAAAVAATTSNGVAGIQAVVVHASHKALRHIRRSPLVQHVVQDREIITQQTAEADAVSDTPAATVQAQPQAVCVETRYLTTGIPAAASAQFRWPGCRITGSTLVWFGRTCGDGSKVLYNQVRSVRQDGSLINNCILRRDATRITWTRQRLGACGIAPTFAASLPTRICSPTGGGGGSPPPPLPPSNPPPEGTNQVLPKVPVAAGEEVTPNMQRIEAVTAAGVDNIAGLPASQQIAVAVVDSGIDGTHPDLNVVGGKSWATPSSTLAGDVADYDVDLYGHGTHVAGIIGAKNSGQGVMGVVPNVPLYSLKVFNGQGKGSLSTALDAVRFTYSAAGKAARIGAINLSLASKLDATSTTYQKDLESLCTVFKEASDNGILITAAAGNYATNMRSYIPASCPTVLAVTSLDVEANTPSGFSNYLPADASAAEKATLLAAPGSQIYSTISYNKFASGYAGLSGTSMASPHVAGVAAACVMSGACSAAASGVAKAGIVQTAAQQRVSVSADYGYTESAGKHHGPLVWAGW